MNTGQIYFSDKNNQVNNFLLQKELEMEKIKNHYVKLYLPYYLHERIKLDFTEGKFRLEVQHHLSSLNIM
jgi:hypothetical protein